VGLSEHEPNKLSNSSEDHQDMASSLSLITPTGVILALSKLLCYPGRDLVLIRDILVIVLSTNVVYSHAL